MKKILLSSFITLFFLVQIAQGAVGNMLGLTISSTAVNVGDTATVTVFVTSPTQAINAVSGSVVFPANLSIGTMSTQGSIINFWTEEPHIVSNRIQFEGIVLNPGYTGSKGKLFTITVTAKKTGSALVRLTDGAMLANDGLGTNILGTLGTTTIAVRGWETAPIATTDPGTTVAVAPTKSVILPVITDYSPAIDTKATAYLKGKGAPNALTKIVFKNVRLKSIGERFIDFVQTKKTALDEVLVKNDASGSFAYTSDRNLVAGTYNATPFLVDAATNTERPGLGVQLLVNDSKIVHVLVVAINVLGLLVPIVGLGVLVYFIPWYSARRMHLLKRRIGLEEEKIELTEHKLKSQDKILEKDTEKTIASR